MAISKTSSKKKKKSKQKTCPTCGGVDCFERPRFFSGQLLTDRDLVAAQQYVIEKNKLHNRYLVGTGVVCGLAVRCNPSCQGTILVEPGYAIDCCGNDIVLCESVEQDVVDLLEACRQVEEPDCYEKIRDRRSICDDIEREYFLFLSYAEKLDKPVTALIRDNGCTTNRCEPSRIKGWFRFDLVGKEDFRAVTTHTFWDRAQECNSAISLKISQFSKDFKKLAQKVSEQVPYNEDRHREIRRIFCLMKDYVLELYEQHPKVRCSLYENVPKIEKVFPSYTDNSDEQAKYWKDLGLAIDQMGSLIYQLQRDCICDALLVPCKECDGQEGVLLACLTLQGDKVIKICNTVRKPVLSGSALQYWLQPFYTSLSKSINDACCVDTSKSFLQQLNLEQSLLQKFAYLGPVNSAVQRTNAVFSMIQDVQTNAVSSLQNLVFPQDVSSGSMAATDVYNRSLDDVKTWLRDSEITDIHEKRVDTAAEAYSLGNLTAMSWTVPQGSRVELVVSPENLVTCIRVIEEEE